MNYMDNNIENSFDKDNNKILKDLINDGDEIEYSDVHDMRQSLCIALVNYELNSDMLTCVPHRRFLDLAIIPVWKLGKGFSERFVSVTNSICDVWGVDHDDIINLAIKYSADVSGFVFSEFSGFMNTICQDSFEPDNEDIYILTNDVTRFGASAICYDGILKHIYYRLQRNYYVIPANIDNVFIIPESSKEVDVFGFAMGIAMINQRILGIKDFLSNKIYYYDHEKDKLDIVKLN